MPSEEFESQKVDKRIRFYVDFVEDDPDDWHWAVIDRTTGDTVGEDGGEPEDQLLVRDWAWVPALLNVLADEIERLRELLLAAGKMAVAAQNVESAAGHGLAVALKKLYATRERYDAAIMADALRTR